MHSAPQNECIKVIKHGKTRNGCVNNVPWRLQLLSSDVKTLGLVCKCSFISSMAVFAHVAHVSLCVLVKCMCDAHLFVCLNPENKDFFSWQSSFLRIL